MGTQLIRSPHPTHLLLLALPAVLARIIVLAIAGGSKGQWTTHVLALVLCIALATAGAQARRWTPAPFPARGLLLLGVLGIAVPLLVGERSGPERWLELGPLNLYLAPVLLPAFLLACSSCIDRRDRSAAGAVAGASLVLALQPDASQALALLAGFTVLLVRFRARTPLLLGAWTIATAATIVACLQPDPLEPMPHVEGVFAFALQHSWLAGIAVIAGATALLAGLLARAAIEGSWLYAIAAYYAVLFACSIAGLTPAPMIGYGAAPILGYGLLAGAASWYGGNDDPST